LAEQLVVDADGELARAGRLVDESTCTQTRHFVTGR